MKRCFLIILATVAIAQGVFSQSAVKDNESVHYSLDSCMKSLADSGFSGVALVEHGGQIFLFNSYDKKGRDVDTSMAFWLASNTKQFTAVAILKLQEQGKLSIQDTITKFFKNVPKDKQAITIHHLLSHTSGLGHNYIADGIFNRDEMISKVLAAPLEKPVGSQVYSNDAYCLLAAIIEITSGSTFESYLKKELFAPAGMSHTGFWGFEKENAVKIAQPQMLDSLKSKPLYEKMFRNGATYANWGARGCSGIFSTAKDIYKWLQALKGDKIISAASRKKLFSPYSLIRHDENNIDVSYAYGWVVSTSNGKLIEARHSGVEDWLANSFIRDFENGDIVIAMAYDFGPDSDNMSVLAISNLTKILKQYFRF
jgi:CubicO group peptidase (beta-lactamase class C family)